VLLIAVLLCVPAWAVVRSWHAAREQPLAYIYQDSRLLGVYRLDRDQVINLEGRSRGRESSPTGEGRWAGDRGTRKMQVEIRQGAIRVAESDCPRGVCREMGWVRTPGRSLVCVPNQVLIEVRGESRAYDAQSY